ncbi:hypothetical protein AERO9A_400072 [Aeromonas salmonicida]|nr:hypothetical protein AERO9A_400072 [Aeromonas salmonicida]
MKLMIKSLIHCSRESVIWLASTYFSSRMKIETLLVDSYTRLVPHGTQVKGKPVEMPGRNASGLQISRSR